MRVRRSRHSSSASPPRRVVTRTSNRISKSNNTITQESAEHAIARIRRTYRPPSGRGHRRPRCDAEVQRRRIRQHPVLAGLAGGILKVGMGGEPFRRTHTSCCWENSLSTTSFRTQGRRRFSGRTYPASTAPIYFVFTPRTGSDYGLDERTPNIAHPLPSRCTAPTLNLGRPGGSHTRKNGSAAAASISSDRDENCHPGVRLDRPAAPVHDQSDHLRQRPT